MFSLYPETCPNSSNKTKTWGMNMDLSGSEKVKKSESKKVKDHQRIKTAYTQNLPF